jgi:hypothetical protein
MAGSACAGSIAAYGREAQAGLGRRLPFLCGALADLFPEKDAAFEVDVGTTKLRDR